MDTACGAAIPTGTAPACAALCIGLNYPGTRNELYGCVNDAVMAAEHIRLLWPDADITMLTDAAGLHGAPSTGTGKRAEIMSALANLVCKARAGTPVIVLHYSGHGGSVADTSGAPRFGSRIPTRTPNSRARMYSWASGAHTAGQPGRRGRDEGDGRDETMIASDGPIRDDVLYEAFVRALPSTCTLFATMDCCHSGTILDLPFLLRIGDDSSSTQENTVLPSCKVLAVSGCRDTQTAADAWNREEGRAEGALSGALYRTLSRHLEAYPVADMRRVPIPLLLLELQRSLARNSFTQLPRVSSSHPIGHYTTFEAWESLAPHTPSA